MCTHCLYNELKPEQGIEKSKNGCMRVFEYRILLDKHMHDAKCITWALSAQNFFHSREQQLGRQ